MRKEDVTSLVIYLILIAAAIITGCTVVEDAFKSYSTDFMNPYVFSILTIIIGLVFNIVLLELLHALGAKIGGYEVVLINMVGFCFEKINGKWQFHFRDFDGLTGETKIAPKKEKTSLKPYVWLPIIGYLFELIIGILVYTISQDLQVSTKVNLGWLSVGSLLFIIISSMIALYNLVPLKLDTMTDGYKLVLITKPENMMAYNELMRIENLQRNGEKVTEIKTFTEITDFTASVNLLSIYEDLSKKQYQKANELIDLMISNPKKMEELTYNRLMAQKLYILVMDNKIDEAREFYQKQVDDKLRRFIANDDSMEALRAYAMIAGYLDESESEIAFVIKKLPKAIKNTLKTRAETEKTLFDEAINKIYNEHPNWKKETIA